MQAARAKPWASPTNKREDHYFTEKKEEVGMGCFEQKCSREKEEFRVIMGFHWLSCRGSLSLAGDAMYIFPYWGL